MQRWLEKRGGRGRCGVGDGGVGMRAWACGRWAPPGFPAESCPWRRPVTCPVREQGVAGWVVVEGEGSALPERSAEAGKAGGARWD